MTQKTLEQHLDEFEDRLNLSFNDRRLFQQAFIHRSYINENRDAGFDHNERLEFLGDAVLELVVTDDLYHRFPDKPEGELTSLRAALVNTQTLSEVARDIDINKVLYLSRGEARDTGRARDYILADAVEALIGALYLDKGFEEAKRFIGRFILTRTEEIVKNDLWIDAKSRFQERAQDIEGITPEYRIIDETGPDHDKYFTAGVYLGEELVASGKGQSKQDAEQEAAHKALENRGWK